MSNGNAQLPQKVQKLIDKGIIRKGAPLTRAEQTVIEAMSDEEIAVLESLAKRVEDEAESTGELGDLKSNIIV